MEIREMIDKLAKDLRVAGYVDLSIRIVTPSEHTDENNENPPERRLGGIVYFEIDTPWTLRRERLYDDVKPEDLLEQMIRSTIGDPDKPIHIDEETP